MMKKILLIGGSYGIGATIAKQLVVGHNVNIASRTSEIACFLLTEKSSWMTGQIFGVDGGTSALNLN